jgi:putative DNA primase/helicase
VGFVLAEGDPFVGIDIDHCLSPDGTMPAWVQEIVERVDSYAEISPSGTGLRIFVKGALPCPGFKNTERQLEVYSSGRYLTVTGKVIRQQPIVENQAALDWLCATYRPDFRNKPTGNAPAPRSFECGAENDKTLIQKILDSKGGDTFKRLFFDGDLSAHSGDHSAADLALCNILAFWCRKDPAQMDRIFRASALFRPEKWDSVHVRGQTYGAATIDRAIDGCGEVYQGGRGCFFSIGEIDRKSTRLNSSHS